MRYGARNNGSTPVQAVRRTSRPRAMAVKEMEARFCVLKASNENANKNVMNPQHNDAYGLLYKVATGRRSERVLG